MRVLNRGSPDYGLSNSPQQEAHPGRWASRGSPSWDGGKRKRSSSPPDRYVKPRYEDHNQYGRSRYSQGRAFSPERRNSRNEVQDALNRDTLVPFRQYSDWFKQAHPDEWREDNNGEPSDELEGTSADKELSTMRLRYENYRRSFVRKQFKYMFDYHRKFSWFIEKYDVGERYFDMRERVRQHGWKDAISHFINQLEAGKFDPPLPGAETTVVTSQVRGEEDTEMPEVSISQPTKKLAPGEHMVAPSHPQLMIRTLPPDIGRLQLEELLATLSGFKYVAIGDPVQKRQFYRCAWVAFEFEEDVKKAITELDSKKIQKFRLPVTQISEPFVARIRCAPLAASKITRMEKDLHQAKRLAAVLEARAAELATYKPVFPVGAPLSAEPPAVDDIPVKAEGSGEVKEEDLDAARGSKAVEERIDKIASETLDTDENGNPDREKYVTLSLDMYLSYLREAFHCCYYCAVVTDHAEELVRKCIRHERQEPPTPNTSQENQGKAADTANGNDVSEDRWGDALDHKLACLMDPAAVDPTEYGGTRLEDERAAMTANYVLKEEEGKWRCKECKKLFKAVEFVEKHVVNKHADIIKPEMDEWELFNNFILDPQHILPMQSMPPSTGGATQHPPQAFGLPPDWRPSYSESSRYDRDRGGRDSRDRDRRPSYGGRDSSRRMSPPVHLNKPIRFTVDAETSSITFTGDTRFTGAITMSSSLPSVSSLPAKPVHGIASSASTPSVGSSSLLERMKPPPPPGQKPDPRSRVSYQDLDMVDTSEDIALQY